MVLVEAQACGKPVIAGDSGGTAETMQIPETGRVVACEEPEALARAVSKLLLDDALRQQMGERGRQHVMEHFGWDALSLEAAQLFGVDESELQPAQRARDDRGTKAAASTVNDRVEV